MTERDAARSKAHEYLTSERFLNGKAELVGAIGAAIDDHNTAQQQVTEAQAHAATVGKRVAEAYEAAIEGGWTPAQLAELGYKAPKRERGRRRGAGTRSSATRRSPSTNAAAADIPPADIPPTTEQHQPHE